MTCCARCAAATGWTFTLDGDGDGIEFLTQYAWSTAGPAETTTVVYR